MEPGEALGIVAQVAVTLAGFAGVVVIFRPDSVHQWSSLDRLRLRLLLQNSVCPLAYSLFGMLLLSIKPTPESIWRWCSAFGICFQVPLIIGAFKFLRTFTRDEFHDVNNILFRFMSVLGIGALLLQFVNVAMLNWFWPFFIAMFVHLLAAMLQFMRMVLLLPGKESAK